MSIEQSECDTTRSTYTHTASNLIFKQSQQPATSSSKRPSPTSEMPLSVPGIYHNLSWSYVLTPPINIIKHHLVAYFAATLARPTTTLTARTFRLDPCLPFFLFFLPRHLRLRMHPYSPRRAVPRHDTTHPLPLSNRISPAQTLLLSTVSLSFYDSRKNKEKHNTQRLPLRLSTVSIYPSDPSAVSPSLWLGS